MKVLLFWSFGFIVGQYFFLYTSDLNLIEKETYKLAVSSYLTGCLSHHVHNNNCKMKSLIFKQNLKQLFGE